MSRNRLSRWRQTRCRAPTRLGWPESTRTTRASCGAEAAMPPILMYRQTDGEPAGAIRRLRTWRRNAIADLPGLPLPVQVLVLVVVRVNRDSPSAAAGYET